MRVVSGLSLVGAVVCVATATQAADLPVKAPPLAAATWSGFYAGGLIGGGFADRTVGYTGNDPFGALLVLGTAGAVGEQPFASHGLNARGITGGLEAGANWQLGRRWLLGVETDFSGSGISGTGTGTSALSTGFPQTVSSKQSLDWFGTVRGRLGFIPRDDLLLFATAGLAYGRVEQRDTYIFNGASGATLSGGFAGYSISCVTNTTCMADANARVSVGWALGAGAEWRFRPGWSVKAEYLYIDLGDQSVNAVTTGIAPGTTPTGYKASFGTADYHIARLGLNWHFAPGQPVSVAADAGPLKAFAKAMPAHTPARSWTGFYAGATIGGGFGERNVAYDPTDPASALLVFGVTSFTGQQPFASHGFTAGGVTGGVEIGYNWQLEQRWIIGLEADFNGTSISGSSDGASALQNLPGFVYTQTLTSKQSLDWFGTVRGRLGWLATDDLLLFATAGLAYGRIEQSDSYTFSGPPPAVLANTVFGYSHACAVGTTCFVDSNARIGAGWAAGAGAEWRFRPQWSVKAEYLYINLGDQAVNPIATGVFTAGATPAGYKASFGAADYHIARVGVNYHW